MRKLVPFVILAACLALCPHASDAQDVTWIRQFGTADGASALPVATHSTGVYVAGFTTGSFPTQFNSGGLDAYVRKYDQSGNIVWTRQFGTSGTDRAHALAVDGTGVYVAGITTGSLPTQASSGGSDAFVRRYDFAGNEVWTRQFGTSARDSIDAIAVHAGGVYAWGETDGAFPGQSSGGGRDFFLAKVDVNGDPQWVRQFGTALPDTGSFGAVAVDGTGVYVAGKARAPLPGQSSLASVDGFVRRYDLDGNEVWTRQFGTACPTAALGVAVHTTGVYVTGGTNGDFTDPTVCSPQAPSGQDSTGFLRRFDIDGNVIWTRQIRASGQGPQFENDPEVVVADDSGVYVAGLTFGVLAGQNPGGPDSGHSACPRGGFFDDADAYVRKYAFDGSVRWTRQFGSARLDAAHGIAADGTGVYAAGITDCVLAGQASLGATDAFLVKLTVAPETAEGSIQLIVGQVETLSDRGAVNRGQGHSLNATLRAAADQLERGDVAGAILQMQTFNSKVADFRESGILSPAQAQALIDSANGVLSQLQA